MIRFVFHVVLADLVATSHHLLLANYILFMLLAALQQCICSRVLHAVL